jgi:hypothetical protein
MTEEQKVDSGAPAEEPTSHSQFLDELYSLGQQLTTAVKAMWDSEDSRKLRQEIGDGFVELGRQVDDAVKTAQDSETAHQLSEQVKETMEKARQSDIAAKLEQGLTEGLHDLNVQLAKMVSSMESRGTSQAAPEDAPEGEQEA